MNENEFNDLVDETLTAIEDGADNCDADIDCEFAGGILTLKFEDGSAMIFSRQSATQELWLAAKSGGFHFVWQGSDWHCSKTGETLAAKVAACSLAQGGEALIIG